MTTNQLVENMRVIWAEALNVSVDDTTDFFWEGGHSFMALDIIARAEESLNLKVPLRLLFDYPRFDNFVSALEGLMSTADN